MAQRKPAPDGNGSPYRCSAFLSFCNSFAAGPTPARRISRFLCLLCAGPRTRRPSSLSPAAIVRGGCRTPRGRALLSNISRALAIGAVR